VTPLTDGPRCPCCTKPRLAPGLCHVCLMAQKEALEALYAWHREQAAKNAALARNAITPRVLSTYLGEEQRHTAFSLTLQDALRYAG
jgi:hypothetical protein